MPLRTAGIDCHPSRAATVSGKLFSAPRANNDVWCTLYSICSGSAIISHALVVASQVQQKYPCPPAASIGARPTNCRNHRRIPFFKINFGRSCGECWWASCLAARTISSNAFTNSSDALRRSIKHPHSKSCDKCPQAHADYRHALPNPRPPIDDTVQTHIGINQHKIGSHCQNTLWFSGRKSH